MDMSLADSQSGENNISALAQLDFRVVDLVKDPESVGTPFSKLNWYYFANFCFHSFDTVGYVANTRSTNS